jgi:hypothetical protein
MAATGREASILACSLQQPCRVCQQLHITPSELQVGTTKHVSKACRWSRLCSSALFARVSQDLHTHLMN